MKLKRSGIWLNSEGRGFIGCMLAIVLLASMIFAAVKLGPVYYSNYLFEDDLKNLTSQAGSHYIKDERIVADIIRLAKENDINLKEKDAEENIKIERFAGQIHIRVLYYVPVNFMLFKKTLKFEISLSSFTAT